MGKRREVEEEEEEEEEEVAIKRLQLATVTGDTTLNSAWSK